MWVFENLGWFFAFAAISLPLTLRPGRIGPVAVPPGFWECLDGAASRVLRKHLGLALGVAAGLLLASWVPHFLTWPWWADTEYFAVIAQSWDSGILPYRDLYDFNFPGPTYLHWVFGKAFGWGHELPFNVFDVVLLVLLGVALAVWSRDRFGGAVPGLIGYLAVLGHYCNLDYTQVAQRDWHATLLSVLALLALEARRGRVGLIVSGLAYAAALAFRPYPVLFLPAMLSAVDENARELGEPRPRASRAVAAWSGVVALGLLAAAAPVVLAWVADDFLRWFKVAWYGGGYHGAERRSLPGEVLDQLRHWETFAALGAVAVLAVVGDSPRRVARTWSLAFLGVLLYRPLSPVSHDYLGHPLILIRSVAFAVAAGWALRSSRFVPSVRLLAFALLMTLALPGVPRYCLPAASVRAAADLARGTVPRLPPPGCDRQIRSGSIGCRYSWKDYRAVLDHLRRETSPRTLVANVLRGHPFPALNGPVGRLTPFPTPGGILWLRGVDPGLEVEFADALVRSRDAVVVWDPDLQPGEPKLRLLRLEQTIRRHYQPEIRFGNIEVWRRKVEVSPTGGPMRSSRVDPGIRPPVGPRVI